MRKTRKMRENFDFPSQLVNFLSLHQPPANPKIAQHQKVQMLLLEMLAHLSVNIRYKLPVQTYGTSYRYKHRYKLPVQTYSVNYRYKRTVQITGTNIQYKFPVQTYGTSYRYKHTVQITGTNIQCKLTVQTHGTSCRYKQIHLRS